MCSFTRDCPVRNIHMVGCPVLADKLYGGRGKFTLRDIDPRVTAEEDVVLLERQALHAYRLRFLHPKKGTWLEVEAPLPSPRRKTGITRNLGPIGAEPAPVTLPHAASERVVFFDVETQRSAEEVGGWGNISRMGLALAVVYDAAHDRFRTYFEGDVVPMSEE